MKEKGRVKNRKEGSRWQSQGMEGALGVLSLQAWGEFGKRGKTSPAYSSEFTFLLTKEQFSASPFLLTGSCSLSGPGASLVPCYFLSHQMDDSKAHRLVVDTEELWCVLQQLSQLRVTVWPICGTLRYCQKRTNWGGFWFSFLSSKCIKAPSDQ